MEKNLLGKEKIRNNLGYNRNLTQTDDCYNFNREIAAGNFEKRAIFWTLLVLSSRGAKIWNLRGKNETDFDLQSSSNDACQKCWSAKT